MFVYVYFPSQMLLSNTAYMICELKTYQNTTEMQLTPLFSESRKCNASLWWIDTVPSVLFSVHSVRVVQKKCFLLLLLLLPDSKPLLVRLPAASDPLPSCSSVLKWFRHGLLTAFHHVWFFAVWGIPLVAT